MNKAREHAKSLFDYLNETTLALPPRRKLDTIASEVTALHQAAGGATYHPRFGDITGQQLWAIAPYIERTQIVPGKRISQTRIKQFARANSDLLANPKHLIGTWYNQTDNETYLDIVLTLPSLDSAIAAAMQADQIAIYDLEARQEIETGGTGKPQIEDTKDEDW